MVDEALIHETLKRHFGFDAFKAKQFEIISSLLEGNDVFVLMPTGGGKSMCYQLPAIIMDGTAIVISPLIALMKNQVDAMRNISSDNGIAHFLNSSLGRKEVERVKNDVREGRTKLLYVAPESLCKEDNIAFLKSVNISFYAVDEAHCISEWGHDFRPEYRKIRQIIQEIGPRPIIALTATATPKVQNDIRKNLGMLESKVFKSSFNRPNLYYEVRPKTRETIHDIVRYIRNNAGKSGIIYCRSRKRVEEVAAMLSINGIKALPYHAGMDAATRAANQDAFLMEDVDVIVATIAFGMGIDKPDVRYVIHYDIPKSLEGYYQETGRAGRDDGEGKCILYYSPQDVRLLGKLVQSKSMVEQEIAHLLLMETVGYAESSVCRRKILMSYFGELYEEDNCGNCDNCIRPKQRTDASEELRAIIETALAIHEIYRPEYIVNILQGKATDEIKWRHHEEIETFGVCQNDEDRFLLTIIKQGIIAGYLIKDLENFGTIKVTDAGRQFLSNDKKFYVVEDSEYSDADYESTRQGGGAADEVLFAMLKDLRKDVAHRNNLPPYIVFQDPSLESMATLYPVTIEELQNISGVGIGKAHRYGEPFIELIKQYVEENDIERPEDMRLRTPTPRSSMKINIIQSIDRKIALDDLAETRGLEFNELLDELDSIVDSGTKISIDYYINDYIDEERQRDALEYFRNTEEDNIEAAINALGEDFTEEEVRLMRIKFISLHAN